MSLNAQALRLLAEKGLTASDIAELAEALEVRRDPTAAERMRRYRAKKEAVVTRNVTPVTDAVPLDDIYSNPPGFDVSSETSAVSDFSDRVVEDWNQKTAGTPLPKARKLNTERRKHLRCRVREHGEDAVFTAIENMIASDFHSGRSGKWVEGNLGWLLKSAENFQKMLERKPEGRPAAVALSPAERAAAQSFSELQRAYQDGEISFDEMMSRKGKPPDEQVRRPSGPTPIGKLVQRIQDQAA